MKRTILIFCLAALVIAGMVFTSGCSQSKGRSVNVEAGEYFSEEDYEELSKKEKSQYCEALAKELTVLKTGAKKKNSELESTNGRIELMKSELTPVESELLRVESDIRTLNSQIAELEALPETHSIEPGECLWLIAEREEIYGDPSKWPRILRANEDIIEDPHYVYPDTILTIPRDWPSTHTVKSLESLYLIAGYWEVYDNPADWPKLYEANKNQIKDPHLIEIEQVLTIPR